MTTEKTEIEKKSRLEKMSDAAVFAMLFIISGIYGFIYEIIFYYFNGGMQYVYWRGGHFAPWILIYGIGGLVIYLFTYRLKKHPLLVLLSGGLGCGALEFLAGAVEFYLLGGRRSWDYNTEILNFGNIGGFICLRSVLVFGISSLLLMYVVLPLILRLRKKLGSRAFVILTLSIACVFAADLIYNAAAGHILPSLVSANEFYSGFGLRTVSY